MRKLRLLALHGKEQTAETFRTRIGRLPHKARNVAEFRYIDAPYTLPVRSGDEVPLRTWYHRDAHNHVECSSVEQTMDYLSSIWKNEGPFDGVLGFSMGGTIAVAMAALPFRFPALRCIIVIGGPHVEEITHTPISSGVSSLHIMGTADRVVSVERSKKLAGLFTSPQIIEHPQGHCLPGNLANSIVSFLESVADQQIASVSPPPVPTVSDIPSVAVKCSEVDAAEQSDELEALLCIYPDVLTVSTPSPCGVYSILLTSCDIPDAWRGKLGLKFTLPPTYPSASPPAVEVISSDLSLFDFPSSVRHALLRIVTDAACVGSASIMQMVQAANDWFSDGTWKNVKKIEHHQENNQDIAISCNAEEPSNLLIEVQREQGDNAEVDDAVESDYVRIATEEACAVAAAVKAGKRHDLSKTVSTSSASGRGVWTYTVGLVGKPSAGKSTFYNAVTRAALERNGRLLADVSPHPFTTIEPNVGPGWYASPVSSDEDAPALRGAAHGRDAATGRRLLPVIVKDVAGLVPGAYKGRGKGNKFLNDLCDADVLVHVVDVTGRADRDGNVLLESEIEGGSSPMEDSEWIRQELHRWIYGNVRGKWQSVGRKSKEQATQRLIALFSGYQGGSVYVEMAAERAQLDTERAAEWTSLDLHRLVAHFLSLRFPICLALNKVDSLSIDQLSVVDTCKKLAQARGEVAVPVCAAAECWILKKSSQRDLPPVGSEIWNTMEKMVNVVQSRYGSTGVLNAISAAVALKPPVLVYPVCDLESELPVVCSANRSSHEGVSDSHVLASEFRLKDCIQMKPGSTTYDVFEALKRGCLDDVTVTGEFVRAEGRALARNSKKVLVGRDCVVDETNCVMRIHTNRKPVWQAAHSALPSIPS